MAHRKFDLVQETSTSTGTGAMALAGASSSRRRTFGSLLSNADTCYVLIENASAAEWEICLATYATSGNQLTRGAVLASSTGSAVAFSGGVKTISLIAPASKAIVEDNNGDVTVTRNVTAGAVGTRAQLAIGMQGSMGRIRERDTNNNLAITTNIDDSGTTDNAALASWKFRMGAGSDNVLVARAPAGSSTFTDLLALTATGLGIGKTAAQKLDVAGSIASNNLLMQGDNTNAYIRPTNASSTLFLGSNNANQVSITAAGVFQPVAGDNTQNLGGASNRWAVVYAGTGTINTSGRDTKVGIRAPLDAERRAARRILDIGPKLYQFRDAYDAKGDAARLHAGYIAEDVRDALEAEGLDPWRYGFMCADDLTRTEEYTEAVERPKVRKVEATERAVEIIDGKPVMVTRTVEREEPVGRMVPVLDQDGTPVMVPGEPDADGNTPLVPMLHFVPEVETVEEPRTREVPTGEKRLGLRYSELEAFLKCAAPAK